jgi:hypothetical protein
MVSKPELFEATQLSRPNSIRFFVFCGWMKSEVYKTRGGCTRTVACVLDAGACVKKREDQLG